MTVTIDNAYVRTFESNVRFLAQQGDTRLRNWCDVVTEVGEDHVFETLGTVDAEQKIGRLVATPVMDSPWGNRVATPATYHAGDSTEQEDPSAMLIDPNSKITQVLGMAMRRQVDDVIIDAANATAYDKDGSSHAYDTDNHLIGDGTGVISLDLITQALETFDADDVPEEEPKVWVFGPTQKRKMLQLLEVTSADFQSKKALTNGFLPDFLGFTWIMSNRLNYSASGKIYNLVFTKWALGLHITKDIWARVAEDASASFAWRLYTAMTMGAVRVEDEQMLVVHLKDDVS